MELEYFVVCRSVSMDLDTDELSLIGVLEDVFVEEFPAEIPRIVAISCWRIAEHERDIDVQATLFVRPPGEDEGATFTMNFARDITRHRAVQAVLSVPVFSPGELLCEVKLNGEHAARHIITVHQLPPGPAGSDTEVKAKD